MRALRDYSCPECGVVFQSRTKDKKFCTLKCYALSSEGAEKLRQASELGAAARRQKKGLALLHCSNCNTPIHCLRRRANQSVPLCSPTCRRAYWSNLFDQFIANPEGLPLPQNYDEFLAGDELHCILPGCEWVGKSLGGHLYHFHGITADEFKEVAQFNRRTGLVGAATATKLAEPHIGQDHSSFVEKMRIARDSNEKTRTCHPGIRLEGKEHFVKARLGRKHTSETKAKMREAWQRRKQQVKTEEQADGQIER